MYALEEYLMENSGVGPAFKLCYHMVMTVHCTVLEKIFPNHKGYLWFRWISKPVFWPWLRAHRVFTFSDYILSMNYEFCMARPCISRFIYPAVFPSHKSLFSKQVLFSALLTMIACTSGVHHITNLLYSSKADIKAKFAMTLLQICVNSLAWWSCHYLAYFALSVHLLSLLLSNSRLEKYGWWKVKMMNFY